jgi:hypothetical protein
MKKHAMQCRHHKRCFRKKKQITEADRSKGIKQITEKVEPGKETGRLDASAPVSNAHFASCDVVKLAVKVMSVGAQ